ncbi:MAG: PfkB family carbohydrate kinase, partial [Chloroflexota bacterium]
DNFDHVSYENNDGTDSWRGPWAETGDFGSPGSGDIAVKFGAQPLLAMGPHTVVVSRGKAGSFAVSRNEVAEQPGLAVNVVDTTGAGDTFYAAFLHQTLQGTPLADRLRFANTAAALSVTALGPRGLLPTIDEVNTFLAGQS